MATTTAKQCTAHPMSYYREMVKDMDDSQKRELVSKVLLQSYRADEVEVGILCVVSKNKVSEKFGRL
ncbi:MAG: hypothetical protein J6E29_04140 [Prevotella sp.]|nr:hypothetical protein [Prevotella sp.]